MDTLPKEKKKLLVTQTSTILNAKKRQDVYQKQKQLKSELKSKQKKRKLREIAKLVDAGERPVKAKPRTIENTAGDHHTVVLEGDTEVDGEEAMDEFASYFSREVTPKLCITTGLRPTNRCYDFVRELLYVFPKSFYYPRNGFAVKDIVTSCVDNDFTDVIIINDDDKEINGMTVIHLPEGPTAYFKLSSVRLNKEMKGVGSIKHIAKPEVILNRFNTRVGKRCARILTSLFNPDPFFKGRRVMTFHNQRDFIFFRNHRYVFERVGDAHAANDEEARKLEEEARLQAKIRKLSRKNQKARDIIRDAPKLIQGESIINKSTIRCRIQEVGPQFTMRLKWIQHGTFDKQHGEYEWKMNNDMKTHKKKFLL